MKKKVPLKVWKIQDQRSSAGVKKVGVPPPREGGSILKQQKGGVHAPKSFLGTPAGLQARNMLSAIPRLQPRLRPPLRCCLWCGVAERE